MKFSNGAWLWADGVVPHCMRRVALSKLEKDSIWLAACDRTGKEGIDRVDPIPNRRGSPGLFGDATNGVFYRNLKVTAN